MSPCCENHTAYQRPSPPLVGCSRTDGNPGRTGTAWLRCKEISPLRLSETLSCRPTSSAPTTSQPAGQPVSHCRFMVSPAPGSPSPTKGRDKGPLVARWAWGGQREGLPLCVLDESFLQWGVPYVLASVQGKGLRPFCIHVSTPLEAAESNAHYTSGRPGLREAWGLLRKGN